jgi:hypothetical protein
VKKGAEEIISHFFETLLLQLSAGKIAEQIHPVDATATQG